MAKVTYGGLLTKLQGSIGGVTFQDNVSGCTARLKPHPNKSSSNAQRTIINIYQYLLNQWSNLSPANKLLWSNYAAAFKRSDKYGVERTLTGLNWFNCINYYYYYFNGSILDSPPAHIMPAGVQSFELLLTDTDIRLRWDDIQIIPDANLLIFASYPVKSWSSQKRPAYRYIGYESANGYELINITDRWKSAMGLDWLPSATGCKFFLSVYCIHLSTISYINSDWQTVTEGFNNVPAGIDDAEIDWSFVIS